jgi:hypothetical protein
MEARRVPGLYAIGEAVDVTGWLGGYNFQWAWGERLGGGAGGLRGGCRSTPLPSFVNPAFVRRTNENMLSKPGPISPPSSFPRKREPSRLWNTAA